MGMRNPAGDEQRTADSNALVHTPLASLAGARSTISNVLRDDNFLPDRTRIRFFDDVQRESEELIAMGDMYIASHGGSLRTFSGNLTHENGWWPAYKRGRLQHWEGTAQRNHLIVSEVDLDVLWAQSEARRFEFALGGRRRRYTCDLELRLADNTVVIVEIKRDEADLADEDYQLTLAGVAEICRRCGWVFKIVFAREIFVSPQHRLNAELFQSRRFARVGPEHVRRLHDFALSESPNTSYEALSLALEPDFQPAGAAVVQALLVRRQVQIDLTQHPYPETPVHIL